MEGIGNGAEVVGGGEGIAVKPAPVDAGDPTDKLKSVVSKPGKVKKAKRVASPPRAHSKEKKMPTKVKKNGDYSGGKIGIAVAPKVSKDIRRLRASLEMREGERISISETVGRAVAIALKSAGVR